jgi:hypothetical protein
MMKDWILILAELLFCASAIIALIARAGARRSALLDAAAYCRLCGYSEMATDLEHWAGIQPGSDIPHDDALRRVAEHNAAIQATERAFHEQMERWSRDLRHSEPPSAP